MQSSKMSLKSRNRIFFGFWHFLLGYCLGFGENLTEIGQLVPKLQTVEGLNKQQGTKTIGFVWLYLKNSICEF